MGYIDQFNSIEKIEQIIIWRVTYILRHIDFESHIESHEMVTFNEIDPDNLDSLDKFDDEEYDIIIDESLGDDDFTIIENMFNDDFEDKNDL